MMLPTSIILLFSCITASPITGTEDYHPSQGVINSTDTQEEVEEINDTSDCFSTSSPNIDDTASTISDCEDNPSMNTEDLDGDGFTLCDGDCDDENPNLTPEDTDGDGISSCDGDCQDNDPLLNAESCPRFVDIVVDPFTMGTNNNEIGRSMDENIHGVTLTHDFIIMETEVTQGFYSLLTGNNPANFYNLGENYPVENVSWHDAAHACNLFSELTGFNSCYNCSIETNSIHCESIQNPYNCEGYRLPTEAEWEYSSRSGTQRSFWTTNGGGDLTGQFADVLTEDEYSSGSTQTTDCSPYGITLSDGSNLLYFAWYCGNNQSSGNNGYGTKPVGLLEPNAWGLFDMHGNVYEWVHDSYAYYPNYNVFDPYGCEDPNFDTAFLDGGQCGLYKIQRGGHWAWHPKELRSASRKKVTSTIANKYAGFRMVRIK